MWRGPGPAWGAAPRLQKGQHGCKEFLGNATSFFRFISGNQARGEERSAGQDEVKEGAPKGTHLEQGG